MTEFAERMVGSEAIPYIRERLRTGKEFGAHLLDALDLANGSTCAFVPIGASDEEVREFTDGIAPISPDQIHNRISEDRRPHTWVRVPRFAHDWLLAKLAAHLGGGTEKMCIFEDWFPSPKDAYWSDPEHHKDWATFVGDDVYHVLLPGDDPDRILWTVRQVDSAWPGALGAFTKASVTNRTLRRRSLNPSDWRVLAEATTSLVVGAYDCESYLVWTLQ